MTSAIHLTPSDLLHTSPHIPHIVLLKFGLQLPPVGVFTGPQHIPEFMLHSPQFFPVSRPERPLLLVKKSFQVIGDPWLIIREAAYSPGWHGGVFTEPDVFCDAVGHAVEILSMWLNKYIPVSRLKAVL